MTTTKNTPSEPTGTKLTDDENIVQTFNATFTIQGEDIWNIQTEYLAWLNSLKDITVVRQRNDFSYGKTQIY